ncbi:hypothetical protein ACHAXA_003527 [Cyclostephanos tholiformis]|uniref:Uncharacterized protein n=1 Tax=Cyclostephanos tholiformis TaxID=382380 RepID=A0ABD3R3Y9_9STRA
MGPWLENHGVGSPSKLWRSNKHNNSSSNSNSGFMSSSSRGGGISLIPIMPPPPSSSPPSSSSGAVNVNTVGDKAHQHSRYSSSSALSHSGYYSSNIATFRQRHFVLFAVSLSLLVGISIGGALFGFASFCNVNYDVLDNHHLVVPAGVNVKDAGVAIRGGESMADAETPAAPGSYVAIETRVGEEDGGGDIVSAIEAAAVDNDDIETGDDEGSRSGRRASVETTT